MGTGQNARAWRICAVTSAGAMTCPGHREAGARDEDQAGKPWRRKHTGTGKQPGTADELYGHDAGVCHAVALRMDGRTQLVAEGDRRTITAAQVAAVRVG